MPSPLASSCAACEFGLVGRALLKANGIAGITRPWPGHLRPLVPVVGTLAALSSGMPLFLGRVGGSVVESVMADEGGRGIAASDVDATATPGDCG